MKCVVVLYTVSILYACYVYITLHVPPKVLHDIVHLRAIDFFVRSTVTLR